MMNATNIDWATRSWNPIVGCLHNCSFCYGRRFAERGMGEYGKHPKGARFKPRFLPERLEEPLKVRKPSRIFVCSMGDMFSPGLTGPDVLAPDKVLYTMTQAYWHTFLLLTKHASEMYLWAKGVAYYPRGDSSQRPISGLPPNTHWGVSVTNQQDADERIPWLLKTPAALRWISVEPLQAELNIAEYLDPWRRADGMTRQFIKQGVFNSDQTDSMRSPTVQWVVVGQETGNRAGRVVPERAWIASIVAQCRAADVAVFMKGNLAGVWGEELIQEMPK